MRGGWVVWVPAATWAAVLFFVSSRATLEFGFDLDLSGGRDKLAHLMAYLVLGFLLASAAIQQRSSIIVAVALGLLYGLLDEIHQSRVPGRSAEFADWVADATGTLVGVFLFLLVHRIRGGWRDDIAAPSAESTTT